MADGSVGFRGVVWPQMYASRLFYSDAVIIIITFTVFALVGLSSPAQTLHSRELPSIPYWLALTVLAIGWLMALDAVDTRDRHIVGNGILEYRRIVTATLIVFGATVVVAFFFRIDVARSLLVIAMPGGLVLLLLSRWMWRKWLRRRQSRGSFVYRAVVIGESTKVVHVVEAIRRAHGTGLEIVGAVTRSGEASVAGVPVIGNYQGAESAMDAVAADTLIVAGADDLSPKIMRRLGWSMADRENNLIVAPGLTDVAGPRIHTRPAAGLPLVHVEFPTLEGYKRVLKRSFDIVGSALLILLFSPVMMGTMIAIKADTPGPLYYTQTRIGRRGRAFEMIKFRSMRADADDQLASMLDVQGTSDRPLFKVTNDPRITRVGRFIRKHSIDELPQLFNVLRGEMSLVGPRPQRPAEVELYDDDAHRRLHVKPGMSGLWQVSGRSSLSWDDALRLDLYYVENWSFTQDIQILFRTVRAVVAPGNSAS